MQVKGENLNLCLLVHCICYVYTCTFIGYFIRMYIWREKLN